VRAGLGTTLLPELAVDAGLLMGTSLVTRPLQSDGPQFSGDPEWKDQPGEEDIAW